MAGAAPGLGGLPWELGGFALPCPAQAWLKQVNSVRITPDPPPCKPCFLPAPTLALDWDLSLAPATQSCLIKSLWQPGAWLGLAGHWCFVFSAVASALTTATY